MRSGSELPGRGERARIARRALGLLEPDADLVTPALERVPFAQRWRDTVASASRRRGWRLDPGVRGAVAMGIVAAGAALLAGWWVFSARPTTSALAAPSTVAASSGSPASSTASSSAAALPVVVVDVVGRVHTPGIYRLPVGSRVYDAIQAAGGALPDVDLSTVNLAGKVADGQQLAIGITGAPAAAPASGGAAPPSGPVDLNTASLAELDALPGVGPVLAQHILDWRTAHGRFESVDQLREVSGIGAAKFADLRGLVTV